MNCLQISPNSVARENNVQDVNANVNKNTQRLSDLHVLLDARGVISYLVKSQGPSTIICIDIALKAIKYSPCKWSSKL